MTIRRTLLIERLKMMAMILEAREDGLIKRFVPIIVKNFTKLAPNYVSVKGHVDPYAPDAHRKDLPDWYSTILPHAEKSKEQARIAEGIIRFIVAMDPDPKATYSTWNVNMFAKGELNLEDTPRLFNALALYTECKRLNHIPRSHDIGTLKTPQDLYALVEPFSSRDGREVVDTSYEKEMYRQSDVLVDTDSVIMLHPKTQEAAQWFGRNTDWCTAYGGQYGIHKDRSSLYVSYASKGPLYIILDKHTGELFQFHRETSSYMDQKDRRIDISVFSRKYPEVLHWFVTKDRDGRTQVGTIGRYIVYDTGSALECADGIGLTRQATPLSINYAFTRDVNGQQTGPKTITGIHVGYHSKDDFFGSKELCDLLTRLKMVGSTPDLTGLEIAYDAQKKRYSTIREAGRVICKLGEYSWIEVTPARTGVRRVIRLYGAPDDTIVYLTASFYKDDHFDLSRDGEFEDDDLKLDAILALARALKNPNIQATISTNDLQVEVDDPKHVALAKEYPGIVNIIIDWKTNGDSKRFRQRLANCLNDNDNDAPMTADVLYRGDDFTLRRYKDIKEAINEIGDGGAKFARAMFDGDGDAHYSGSGYVPDDLPGELLSGLSPTDKKAVWDYIVKEENIDDAEDYGDLEELYSAYPNADVASAIGRAASYGEEAGYEKAVSDDFWKSIRDSSLEFYVSQEWDDTKKKMKPVKPHWSRKAMFDTPCALWVNLSSYMDKLDDYDHDDPWDNFNPIEEMELQINLQEPHYGWSGFDEEVAKERFLEALSDEGVIN